MPHRENDQGASNVQSSIRELLAAGGEAGRRYLRLSFCSSVMRTLFRARREAGKTQEDIAKAIGTTQSAIARLENMSPANVTLGRYVDYALACDLVPLELTFVPVEQLVQYAADDPDAPRTPARFQAWKLHRLATAPQPTEQETSPYALGQSLAASMLHNLNPINLSRLERFDEWQRSFYAVQDQDSHSPTPFQDAVTWDQSVLLGPRLPTRSSRSTLTAEGSELICQPCGQARSDRLLAEAA